MRTEISIYKKRLVWITGMYLEKERKKTYICIHKMNRENIKKRKSYFFNRRRRFRYLPNKILPKACRKSGEKIV